MNETQFWQLVEEAKSESTPALSNQPEILTQKLTALPPGDILEFDRIFWTLHAQAYRWDLWAAAYIIEGGCSDDGFVYFRAGLIGLGRAAYQDALRDPNTLVRQPTRGLDFSQEDLLYAAANAYEAVTGKAIPDRVTVEPAEPVGEPWDEETVEELYPELAAKFGSS